MGASSSVSSFSFSNFQNTTHSALSPFFMCPPSTDHVKQKDNTAGAILQDNKTHESDSNVDAKKLQSARVVMDEVSLDRISAKVIQSVTARITRDLSELLKNRRLAKIQNPV